MESLRKNHNKVFSLKQARKITIILIFIFSLDFLLSPTSVMAGQAVILDMHQIQEIQASIGSEIGQDALINVKSFFSEKLPENKNLEIKWSKKYVITAYNSEAGQTDGSPCITANNFNVCEHGIEDTIAANFLPFGAKVKIPELFGDKVFVVRDRMNKRHRERVDVWMLERSDAINFGVKLARIDVLE